MIKTSIALASTSPRRLELLRSLDFTVRTIGIHHLEEIDPSWKPEDVPIQLALQKSRHAESQRNIHEILVTADTVVIHEDTILQKPANKEEARYCLKRLSNTFHKVITGVCLTYHEKIQFSVSTTVWMSKISRGALEYYIDRYQPYDKAGAYGIQEWIGWSHVQRIEGSYSNVMGLPTCEVYKAIRRLSG